MNVKSMIAAVALSTAAVSAQAGGLLNAEQTQAPAAPPPMAAQPTGSLGSPIIPIALGVGLLALAMGGSDSGGGS